MHVKGQGFSSTVLTSHGTGILAYGKSAMAEINKLSVEKALEKLRSNDAQKRTKEMQLEEKVDTLDEEVRRLRAQTRRLKPGRRPGTTKPD